MALKAVQFAPQYCAEAKALADEKGHRPFDQWDSSHDLSIIDSAGVRHRVGTFKHADWAEAVGKLIEEHGLVGLS